MVQRFDHHDFEPRALAAAKGRQRISVVLPARNEAATVATIVGRVRESLIERLGLVDEIVVIDDHSDDGTAEVARAAGASIIDARTTLARFGAGPGKGKAMWKSVFATDADIIVCSGGSSVGGSANRSH